MANVTGLRLVHADDGYELQRAVSPPERRYVNSGRALRTKYLAYYDNGHNRRFSREKEIDQDARIQSFEHSCLLSTIVARATNGDVSVLQKARGIYCDTTGMPMDSRGAHDLINRTRGVFDALSKEEKARYHDDFANFIGSFGSTAGIEAFVQSRLNKSASAASATAAAVPTSSNGGDSNESQ